MVIWVIGYKIVGVFLFWCVFDVVELVVDVWLIDVDKFVGFRVEEIVVVRDIGIG